MGYYAHEAFDLSIIHMCVRNRYTEFCEHDTWGLSCMLYSDYCKAIKSEDSRISIKEYIEQWLDIHPLPLVEDERDLVGKRCFFVCADKKHYLHEYDKSMCKVIKKILGMQYSALDTLWEVEFENGVFENVYAYHLKSFYVEVTASRCGSLIFFGDTEEDVKMEMKAIGVRDFNWLDEMSIISAKGDGIEGKKDWKEESIGADTNALARMSPG